MTRAGLILPRIHGRELAPSGGKIMRKALEQLRRMERYWNTILEAFKRYAEGKMNHTKVDADRNGAPARKESDR